MRAVVASCLIAEPPFPSRMPRWPSRSTMICTETKSFLPGRSLNSTTLTWQPYGISCSYCKNSFSRTISETKKRSGWSLSWSFGYSVGPSGIALSAHCFSSASPSPVSAHVGSTADAEVTFLNHSTSSSRSSSGTVSILLSTMAVGGASGGGASMASCSLWSIVRSMRTRTASESLSERRTVFIMTCSSLLRVFRMKPGVSTRMICDVSLDKMPTTR
mmetsp:Transcript_23552/g.60444  ORF Transcript_23552/g.60444 Transcript_23552/m.60444 type:complete len:217 (+) Transcript_23552:1246-1896(+)